MYNIDTRNIKKGILFYLPFLGMGLLFLVFVFWFTFSSMIKKQSLDSKVEASKIDTNCARDSDGNNMCSPIYYYLVDGKQYSCATMYSSSSSVSSKQKNVYYDSNNPKDCVTDYTASPAWYMYLFCAIPLIFVFFGLKGMFDVKKKLDKIKHLSQYGKLIKGLKYTLVGSGVVINGVPVVAPAVDYTMSNGVVIRLVGDPRHDRKVVDSDGLVDLLIDETNPNNYFIDFEIK